MPVAADPFAVPVEEKAAKLLGINAAALKAGADYCSSQLWIVREEKLFASSRGSQHPSEPGADLAAVHGHGHRQADRQVRHAGQPASCARSRLGVCGRL